MESGEGPSSVCVVVVDNYKRRYDIGNRIAPKCGCWDVGMVTAEVTDKKNEDSLPSLGTRAGS